MAKITLLGDALQIKSTITEKTLKKAQKYCPKACKLIDEDGNELFAIGKGNASCSNHGILFPSADPEGRLFTTIMLNNLPHESYAADRELIKDEFAITLHNLLKVETQIMDTLETINMIERSVEDAIHIEGEESCDKANADVNISFAVGADCEESCEKADE